jgi:hypothetical protein
MRGGAKMPPRGTEGRAMNLRVSKKTSLRVGVLVALSAGGGLAACSASNDGSAVSSVLAGLAQDSPRDLDSAASPPDLESWRKSMSMTPAPKDGCFTVTHPSTSWVEIPCAHPVDLPIPAAPRRQDAARRVSRESSVVSVPAIGRGTDWTAEVSGSISSATGSFPVVSGVTSDFSDAGPNLYSLQLNTNAFNNPIPCSASGETSCTGWVQAVFDSATGVAELWYILNYPLVSGGTTTCPSSAWILNASSCYLPMTGYPLSVGQPPISNLQNMSVSLTVGSPNNTLVMSVGSGTLQSISVPNVIGLGTSWNEAEFNVFGNGNGDNATINAGATVTTKVVTQSVVPTTAAPTCEGGVAGFTIETSNLTLLPTTGKPSCCLATGGSSPSIEFMESNIANQPCTLCGNEGQACCSVTINTGCNSSADVCWNGTCVACGATGESCCDTANGGTACSSGNVCQGGECGAPNTVTVDPNPVTVQAGDGKDEGSTATAYVEAAGAWASAENVAPSVTCNVPLNSGVTCLVSDDISPPTLTFTANQSATSTTAKVCGTLSGITLCTNEAVTVNACQPLTCGTADAGGISTGWVCGSFDNGCGKTVSCGTCPSGETCTGGSCFKTCAGRSCPPPEIFNTVTCECEGGCACGYIVIDGKKDCAVCKP